MMRTCKIYSQQLSNVQYSILNHSHHAVCLYPHDLSVYNWKCVPFDSLHLFLLPHPPAPGHHQSVLHICELGFPRLMASV